MKRILLIQFRRSKALFHERKCFLRFFKSKKILKFLNVFDEKIDFSNPKKLLKGFDGVIFGGSGEFPATKGEKKENFFEILKKIEPFVKHLLKEDFPTLGICFGHQILGHFLGVKIIKDEKQAETGSYFVFLTKEGRESPLFKNLPPKFLAQFGHKYCLKNLPKNAKLLAKTKKCKIVAFQHKQRIFGVQFHPELTQKDFLKRLSFYPSYKKKRLRIKPTLFAPKIIKNFLEII